MAYFRVHDELFAHPRATQAGLRALGLWVTAGSWRAAWAMSAEEIDFIPRPLVRMCGATKADVRALIDAGLWVEDEHGYRMEFSGELWSIAGGGPQRARIPTRIRKAVYARDGHKCVECESTDDLSLDHIYPFSLGGSDTFENLQTLCRSCNSKKGVRV